MADPKQQTPAPEENPYAALYQQQLAAQPSTEFPTTQGTPKPDRFAGLKESAQMVGSGLLGAGKGLMSTATAPAAFLASKLKGHVAGIDPNKLAERERAIQPANTEESIGKGIEQAGEFMLPGGAEEKLASLAPKAARPIARIGTSALGSGAVNALQGGSPVTGAALGAGGAAVGQGIKAAAPVLAETALGMRRPDRAFSKTPGLAILNETRGVRPETIAASAKGRIGELNPELESLANAASLKPRPANLPAGPPGIPLPAQIPNISASLAPARSVISREMGAAHGQNAAKLHGQLESMLGTLSRHFDTGQPIPADVTPAQLVNLKRGLNEEHLGWNPEMHDRALATGRRAYGALDAELDRTVPGAAGINQRISSLIPVARHAESISRGAPPLQRAIGRFGAHTGALVGAGLGATEGRREGGIPGMIAGGATGLLLPELAASPEGQMVLARTLNKAGALKPAVGAAAQLTRKKEDEQ